MAKIYTPSEGEKYESYIKRIKRRRKTSGYIERHHIIPKCMGGNNDDSNLIDLYPEEHYYAHKLLALENPDHPGLNYAYMLMSKGRTPEEYAEAKRKFSKSISGESSPIRGNRYYADFKKYKGYTKHAVIYFFHGEAHIFSDEKEVEYYLGIAASNVEECCKEHFQNMWNLREYCDKTGYIIPDPDTDPEEDLEEDLES